MPIRDTIAAGFASVDELATDSANAFRARMAALMETADGRDEDIWTDAGVPTGMTITVTQKTPVPLRDEEWMTALQSMIAAARWQAFVEIMAPQAINKIAKHSQRTKTSAQGMSRLELHVAAKEGVTKEQFELAKKNRKTT